MSDPTDPADPADRAKQAAAHRACAFVEDGMRVGLGTGSTAAWMVRRLGARVRDEGLHLRCVPTSDRTADLARNCGLPLTTLDDAGWLDVTIDGADEVDPDLRLIKGGGGALLREKIVAAASDRMVVIADDSKRVATLGAFPLPVEALRFGLSATRMLIERGLADQGVDRREIALRMRDGEAVATDGGNVILDLSLGRIGDPRRLATTLNAVPGVVDTGLFLGLADVLVTGWPDGRVEIRDATSGTTHEERVDVAGASPPTTGR